MSGIRLEDQIAGKVLQAYDALPLKFKPSRDAEGLSNWVPLSGIVLTDGRGIIDVVAIATGMKCLPAKSVQNLQGGVMHDSHAEVLAIRLFNHFLLSECLQLAQSVRSRESLYIRRRDDTGPNNLAKESSQPFQLKEQWSIWMYCSEAPCGDASMELTIAKQQDATPWQSPLPVGSSPTLNSGDRDNADDGCVVDEALKGRGFFAELGTVRRKPGRGDSPPTLSKSCSDKLAMKQCTSLLSAMTALLLNPSSAYLHGLIIPSSQYVPAACERAFGVKGRMTAIANAQASGEYCYRPFEVSTTQLEFRFSRRGGSGHGIYAGATSKASNIAAVHSPYASEVLIGGILQGRKRVDPRGASKLSRRRMWGLAAETIAAVAMPALTTAVTKAAMYSDIKNSELLDTRRKIKFDATAQSLKGWVKNEVDDFELN